jgi:3-oxoacyl-[acyl-carrier protein] reductase
MGPLSLVVTSSTIRARWRLFDSQPPYFRVCEQAVLGRAVTIASIHGKEAGGRAWFNMANAAEISLMKSLSIMPDLLREGSTFNTVAPGSIMIPDTGWVDERDNDPEAFDEEIRSGYPLGRLRTPEEVASVVTLLCSKRASLVSGSRAVVDGSESRSF